MMMMMLAAVDMERVSFVTFFFGEKWKRRKIFLGWINLRHAYAPYILIFILLTMPDSLFPPNER